MFRGFSLYLQNECNPYPITFQVPNKLVLFYLPRFTPGIPITTQHLNLTYPIIYHSLNMLC